MSTPTKKYVWETELDFEGRVKTWAHQLPARISSAHIPVRFKEANLLDFDRAEQKIVREFINATGWRCLVVLGVVGVGKTHIACAIAKEFCANYNVLFTSAYTMSEQIMLDRSARAFKNTGVLVIDEISRTFSTKAEGDRVFDVVNHYYENLKPLVLVGNTTEAGVKNIIGPAATDRLRHGLTILTMTGKSRRVTGQG